MAAYQGVGPGRVLSEAQVTKLIARLEQGLAAAGWIDDQRWTLSRVRTLLGRMFQEPSRCPPCGTGCAAPGSPRNNASAAAERNEQAIAHRRRYQ